MNAGVLRYFHPVLPSRHLRRRPVCVRVAGARYVLFRDGGGRAAALDEECPHRRAPLSLGRVREDGRLACPYHGWSFDAHGTGRSPACPELKHCDTRAYQVVERFGYVWLAERTTAAAAFPALGGEAFRFAGSVSATFSAPMEVVLDNISEDEHFPYVHTTFGWDEAGAREVALETRRFEDRSEVQLSARQRRSPWGRLGGVHSGDRFHNQWVTRFDPVHAVYTFWWEDPVSGGRRPVRTRAAVFLVPEAEALTRAHMFLFLDIRPSPQHLLRWLTHWMARRIASLELSRDAALTAQVAAAPVGLAGMRLMRFDEALIHNRKLLDRIYWGRRGARFDEEAGGPGERRAG